MIFKKVSFFGFLLLLVFGALHCTKTTLATEVSCRAVSETTISWNDEAKKMESKTGPTAGEPEQILLKGIGSQKPTILAKNATMALLPIKTDEREGNFQFFEKGPLGTPNLWAFYPRDVKYKKALSKDVLIRMRSYRESIPISLTTVFECQ